MSIQKTKGMAIGGGSEDNEAMAPINLGSGEIEMVDNFTYLGSNLARNSQLEQEIDAHI